MAAPKGHPRYGGRTKGTPNKATAEVKDAAMKYSDDAINTLKDIMYDSEKEENRIKAAMAILDRAHGRPAQAVSVGPQTELSDLIIGLANKKQEG